MATKGGDSIVSQVECRLPTQSGYPVAAAPTGRDWPEAEWRFLAEKADIDADVSLAALESNSPATRRRCDSSGRNAEPDIQLDASIFSFFPVTDFGFRSRSA